MIDPSSLIAGILIGAIGAGILFSYLAERRIANDIRKTGIAEIKDGHQRICGRLETKVQIDHWSKYEPPEAYR